MKDKILLNNTGKKLKELQVEFIDLKVLDLKGRLHSLILPAAMLVNFGSALAWIN